MLFNTLLALALGASSISASTFCQHNSGARGVCVSTNECANYGGTPERGHCPGAANIQCCHKARCTQITRGRCPGDDNWVWINVLGRCSGIRNGLCPGGDDNKWSIALD